MAVKCLNAEIVSRCASEQEAEKVCAQLSRNYPSLRIRFSTPNYDIYVLQGNLLLHDYLSLREEIRRYLTASPQNATSLANSYLFKALLASRYIGLLGFVLFYFARLGRGAEPFYA